MILVPPDLSVDDDLRTFAIDLAQIRLVEEFDQDTSGAVPHQHLEDGKPAPPCLVILNAFDAPARDGPFPLPQRIDGPKIGAVFVTKRRIFEEISDRPDALGCELL